MRRILIAIACLTLYSCASAPAEYEFAPDTEPWVAVLHGETFSIGRLDGDGNFVTPDPNFIRLDIRAKDPAGVPPYTMINSPKGRVYEYRSGRLILGQLNETGDFVPDLDSKVSSLESYLKDYEPGRSLRIYNLPGKIAKKAENKK